jgi:CRP-like cAMP-binding protein
MSTTADVLRAVPLFGGMTDRSIATISQLAEPTSFPAGETLVREGEPGESFIVLTAGEAIVEQGGRTLRTLHAGDFLGEISLVEGGPRTATVTATTPVEAVVVDREGFGRLMEEFPAVRLDLLDALTRRLRDRAGSPTD